MSFGLRGSVIGFALLLLVAAPAAAQVDDEPAFSELVNVLNRIEEIGTGEQGSDQAVARLACRTLGGLSGDRLQPILDHAYAVLRAAYNGAEPFLSDSERHDDLLQWITDDLGEAGLDDASLASLRQALESAHDPEARDMMASYAVNLHVSEIATAVCFLDRRIERGDPVPMTRQRAALDGAVAALQALTVIVSANTTEIGVRTAPSSIAAASTALGGIQLSHAYARLH